MRMTKIIAGILIVLALALALVAWQLMRQSARTPTPPPAALTSAADAIHTAAPAEPVEIQAAPVFHVVVLAQDVPAGHKLSAQDLKLAQLPLAVPGSFTEITQVLGQTTTLALLADNPLFEQQLVSGLALQLEPGQRAISIAVNENMAAGHRVRPGDYVDVFVTLDAESSDRSPVDTQSRLLMARSRVLAYGGATVENPPLTPAQQQKAEQEAQQEAMGTNRRNPPSREDQSLRPENAKTAVLAIPLEDVQRLNLAEKYGQLTLALRHPDDHAVPDASLFKTLPAILRPQPGSLGKDQELQGVDRAFAGMRYHDLATGGDDKNRKRAMPPPLPAPEVSQPQRPKTHPVQVHNGGTVQTVHY